MNELQERNTVYRDELTTQLGKTGDMCESRYVATGDRIFREMGDAFSFLRSYLINQKQLEEDG